MMVRTVSPRMKQLARLNRKELTGPELKLWRQLVTFKEIGAHFRKQVPMGHYIVDFVCHGKRLAIELDGDSHGYDEQRQKDMERDAWLNGQGYTVLRIWNHELFENMDGVLEDIYRHLISDHPTPDPSPSRGGEQDSNPPSPRWGGIEGGGTSEPEGYRHG